MMDKNTKITGKNITYGDYAAYRKRRGSGGARYGAELHVDANAISDPNENETDATTGWAQVGLDAGANVFESQGTVKNIGAYAFHANCNDTPTSLARFNKTFTTIVGATYKLTFDWRHVGTGGDWVYRVEGVVIDSISNTQTSFMPVEFIFTAVATSSLVRFYEGGGSNDGGVYVDNLSFKKRL